MTWFLDWWNALSVMQQVFACFAIPATVILVIQTLLLTFGFGDHGADHGEFDHDFDHDLGHEGVHDIAHDHDVHDGHDGAHHGDGIRLFTVRGFVAFFAVGGWLGIAMLDCGVDPVLSVIIALVAGTLSLLLVAWFMKLLYNLHEDGSIDPKNAVAKTGKVYIKIPAARKGSGKVNLTVQGTYTEMEAVTDCENDITTDTMVQVVSVTADNVLVVRPMTK